MGRGSERRAPRAPCAHVEYLKKEAETGARNEEDLVRSRVVIGGADGVSGKGERRGPTLAPVAAGSDDARKLAEEVIGVRQLVEGERARGSPHGEIRWRVNRSFGATTGTP